MTKQIKAHIPRSLSSKSAEIPVRIRRWQRRFSNAQCSNLLRLRGTQLSKREICTALWPNQCHIFRMNHRRSCNFSKIHLPLRRNTQKRKTTWHLTKKCVKNTHDEHKNDRNLQYFMLNATIQNRCAATFHFRPGRINMDKHKCPYTCVSMCNLYILCAYVSTNK